MEKEKKEWKMPVIEYLMPLKRWEDIKVKDGSFYLKSCVYQNESLKPHDLIVILEYEKTLTIFDKEGRFIVELDKDTEREWHEDRFGQCIRQIRDNIHGSGMAADERWEKGLQAKAEERTGLRNTDAWADTGNTEEGVTACG